MQIHVFCYFHLCEGARTTCEKEYDVDNSEDERREHMDVLM